MMNELMLLSALFPAAYQIANPTTTPEDAKRIMEAVRLAGPVNGLVRMLDNRPDINGELNADANLKPLDKDIWVSREGSNYQSKDPHRLAGTIVHENEHLNGANEIQARERQVKFIQDAIRGKQMKNDPVYMNNLQRKLDLYKWSESLKRK